MFKVLPLYLRNQAEKFPQTPLGPFHTDPAVFLTAPATGLRVTWFGHSASLIEMDGLRVLIDPVWDERAAPVRWAGPKRFFPPTILLEALPPVDVILISHDHYDHLGKSTIQTLAQIPSMRHTRWITSLGVGRILHGFGVPQASITELNWTQATEVAAATGQLTITALPARHFSGRGLTNRMHTLWSSFVLKGPHHRVYYGADTGWWEGFAEIGATYGPFNLTMLETGAYHPLWGDVHLGPENAARAFHALAAGGLFMPIHWGLFDLALHAWRDPIELLTTLAEEQNIPLFSPEPGLPTPVRAGIPVASPWWRV